MGLEPVCSRKRTLTLITLEELLCMHSGPVGVKLILVDTFLEAKLALKTVTLLVLS